MSFITQNAAIAAVHPGDVIAMQSSVAAADAASVGSYHVRIFIVNRTTSQIVHDKYFYSQPLTQTPQPFSENWAHNLPLGNYRFGAWIYNAGYSILPNTQNYIDFVIEPAVASLSLISGDDQGGTVGTTQPLPMVVKALDSAGSPVAGVSIAFATTAGSLSAAAATTGADGVASVTLTHPLAPQKATVTAAIGSLSVSFKQTGHMALYGTHAPKLVMLRPASANADALAGGGFLPDDGKTYQLILGDEFDGASLDLSKWKRRYIYNNGQLDYLNDELERYVDNHVVSDGTLKFTATPRPGTTGHAPFGSITYPLFDSSMIRSITTFKYGYIEARCKLPYERGVWPAMWINPQVGWPPEIDIFEYVVTGVTETPNMIHHNVHRAAMPDGNGRYLYADLNVNETYGYWKAPPALDPNYFGADWHVFGCLWTPDGVVTFYIDGEPIAARRCVWKHDDGSDGGMAHFLLNLAIGGSWPTNSWTTPVPTVPQVMETDYVRIYQDASNIITGVAPV
jgi:beta-glucanase (GH16 family)